MTALETSSLQRLDWLTGSFGEARPANMGPDITNSALRIVLRLGETASISHQPDDNNQLC